MFQISNPAGIPHVSEGNEGRNHKGKIKGAGVIPHTVYNSQHHTRTIYSNTREQRLYHTQSTTANTRLGLYTHTQVLLVI